MYKEKSQISARAYNFALDVIRLTSLLPRTPANLIVIRQVIRSVTSIGANIEEALGGHTRADLAYCMNVAKKEARETRYWLRMLKDLNDNKFIARIKVLLNENEEIINILIKIVKTSSSKK